MRIALAFCAAAAVGLLSPAAFAETAIDAPLMTEAQAARGDTAFAVNCGGCHGVDMVDIFRGYSSAEKYYLFISGSMPADNPGGLERETYVDILAYLLHAVGAPAGDQELVLDRPLLAKIVPGDFSKE